LLNRLCTSLACNSSPSSMPMIHRFGLLMESLSFCTFLLQLLSLLSQSSSVFFFNIYFVFKSWDSVLYLFLSAGMDFPLFFILFKEIFISRVSVWLFFWGFPHSC
jgi:hypothetical protein